jgi:hypothetical protein
MIERIAIKSNGERNGLKIIAHLKRLGGRKTSKVSGKLIDYYYFINVNGHITYSKEIPNGYTILNLN